MEWYLATRFTLFAVVALFPIILIATLLLCGLVSVVLQIWRLFKKKEP